MRLSALLFVLVLSVPGAARAFDHSAFDRLLHAHVKGGLVGYKEIKAEARPVLEAYLESVAKASLKGMSRMDRLAFYINAYNALVIRAVVERYPLRSVKDVPGFFKRRAYRVAGERVSLDELEHKIIRPTFKDARVHFALVCAARSCPPLRAAAFYGKSLDKVLDRLTRSFVNSWQGVRVHRGRVRISQLFDWFADDFRRGGQSVGRFLARYHTKDADLLARTTRFEQIPYDWALNDRR